MDAYFSKKTPVIWSLATSLFSSFRTSTSITQKRLPYEGDTYIIVLGHSNCGGIRALMSDDWEHHDSEFLDRWLCLAQSARNEVVETLGDQPRETQLRACEESSILLSMENLLTFPWIRERADAGKIEIHGWYFNMNNGEMYYYDTEQERFLLLADHH